VLVADGVFVCRDDGSVAGVHGDASANTRRPERGDRACDRAIGSPAARDHLRVALSLEGGAVRRSRLLLLQSRVLAALGEAREADAVRAELLAMEGGETSVARAEAAQDARRPVSRARLRRMVPEVFLIDAAMVG